jgi:hypothetical protein
LTTNSLLELLLFPSAFVFIGLVFRLVLLDRRRMGADRNYMSWVLLHRKGSVRWMIGLWLLAVVLMGALAVMPA